MKKIFAAIAVAAALSVGGCAQVKDFVQADIQNPIAASTQPDTRVLAAYGLITIALEEAAILAENPDTPTPVVQALARVAPVVAEAADLSQIAAIEYRQARDAYEDARARGSSDQQALLTTVISRGLHAQNMVGILRTQLDDLQRAFRQARQDDLTIDQADAILATAQSGFLGE